MYEIRARWAVHAGFFSLCGTKGVRTDAKSSAIRGKELKKDRQRQEACQ